MGKRHRAYSWERHYPHDSWQRHLPRWLWWETPWKYLKRVTRHQRERVKNGYSWYDWISFDTYICQVVADSCQAFRLHGVGYPSGMTEAEWHDILHRIEMPLRWWAEQKFENSLDHKAEMIKYKEAQAAMALFAEHLGSMWD